jgi:hypothetical protein
MTCRKYYEWPNPNSPDLQVIPKVELPEGIEHGSMAGVRAGCTCAACLARKKRAIKRGWRR